MPELISRMSAIVWSGEVIMAGKITSVTMLGSGDPLSFSRNTDGLNVKLPDSAPGESAYTLKITGLQMNPPTWTASGDPMPDNKAGN